MEIERNEFDYREEEIIFSTFWNPLQTVQILNQISEIILSNEFYSTDIDFSVEALSKEVKHVVTEEFELEHRARSVLLASLGILGLSDIRATQQK